MGTACANQNPELNEMTSNIVLEANELITVREEKELAPSILLSKDKCFAGCIPRHPMGYGNIGYLKRRTSQLTNPSSSYTKGGENTPEYRIFQQIILIQAHIRGYLSRKHHPNTHNTSKVTNKSMSLTLPLPKESITVSEIPDSGYAQLVFPDGSKYIGEVLNGKLHGKGCYWWKDGRKYNGEYNSNVISGKGVFEWPDGRKYDGEYFNGQKEGVGQFTWANGAIYQGQWKGGVQHGVGIFSSPKRKKSKKGTWNNGELVRWI